MAKVAGLPLRMRSLLARHPGKLAIGCLALAWALIMHPSGWAQTSNYAQVRALSEGKPEIDRWHWETKDKAWIDGHFYSVKAPGLALFSLPIYELVETAGAQKLADRAVANTHSTDSPHWDGDPTPPYRETGFSRTIAYEVERETERGVPIVWVLGLLAAVLPAALMLLLVSSLGERIEPGYGAVAAVTLGIATIVMTFASEYFSHVIAAMLAFAAFAVLVRERRRRASPWLAAAAGLLAGLAVTFEFPLGLVGIILFAYLLSRQQLRLGRAVAYAGGAVLGALPVLAFNLWAFGSPLQFAYGEAVEVQGMTGHLAVGLNDGGLFGITAPRAEAALDLLFASRGVLILTPVLALALAGAWAMRRGAWRAEANVVHAISAAFFAYNAGYWLEFGGGTPGPRFLIPTLPFLALGLACAWRRWPALTLALAIPSATFMVAASITLPLIGEGGTAVWAERIVDGDLEHTLLTALGVREGWLAIAPVLAAIGGAIALAARATPTVRLGAIGRAVAVVAGWAVLAAIGPEIVGDPVTPVSGGTATLSLIAASSVLAIGTLGVLSYRERRAAVRASAPLPVPAFESSS